MALVPLAKLRWQTTQDLASCISALAVRFDFCTLLIIQISPLDSSIFTVAVCAGSGASVLTGVKADLYITGRSEPKFSIM